VSRAAFTLENSTVDASYAFLFGFLAIVVIGVAIAMLRTDQDEDPRKSRFPGEVDCDDYSWCWGDWGDCDGGDGD
jgi:hypothetical protein